MKHHKIDVQGVTIHAVEMGKGPLVLFAHGFPDTWRGWRSQMEAVAANGYRAVALDMRGYGESSAPKDASEYTIFHCVGDLVAVVAALETKTAVVVGHDFGAAAAWSAAMMRPDRFSGVFALSVPPMVPTPNNFLRQLRDRGSTDFYMFRQMRPEADKEWADAKATLPSVYYWTSGEPPEGAGWDPADPARGMLRKAPTAVPAFVNEADFLEAIADFERTGFHGALNYYRAMESYFDMAGAFIGARITPPSFFLVGKEDGMAKFRTTTRADLDQSLTDLRGFVELEGVGHWPQLEARQIVNEQLLAFLRDVT